MPTYSIRTIFDAALQAGFTPHQATTWTAIALAESGGNPKALNSSGEYSMGLWQVNVASGVRENRWGNLNDPMVNARAAYDISRQGRDMRPWTTTHDTNKGTSHDYRTYLAKVEQVSGVHGDGRGVSGYGAAMPEPLPDAGSGGFDIDAGAVLGGGPDTDGDGLMDAMERALGSDLKVKDSDGDGLGDGFEVLSSRSDPTAADSDDDGQSDSLEVALGTDPSLLDSDHDGLTDAAEVEYGLDPSTADAGDGTAPPAPAPVGITAVGVDAQAAAAAPVVPVADSSLVDRFVRLAQDQRGDPYVYGAEVDLSDKDPDSWDCSELTQWAAAQVGMKLSETAELQYLALKKDDALMSVDEALKTKGALLFRFSQEPTSAGLPMGQAHVAISLGDGRTIEARGRAYGVNEFSAADRFNYGGMLPGLGAPATPTGYDQIDTGAAPDEALDTDHDGLTDAFERLAGTNLKSTDTDRDGLTDAFEAMRSHTDPLAADTDHDGADDAAETALGSDAGRLAGIGGVAGTGLFAQNVRHGVKDTDGDGLSDVYERRTHLDPHRADTDGDGLGDALEVSLGTSASQADTDGDGFGDGLETSLGTDPLLRSGPLGVALGGADPDGGGLQDLGDVLAD